MNVVFACGGTGGHLIPALAIAEVARENGATPVFIGTGKELERKLVGEAGFALESLKARAVVGGGPVALLLFLLSLPLGVFSCVSLFRRLRPDVVVGMGGYPSFIPMLTAFILRIPSVVSEQNVQVGLANKALSLLASRVIAVEGAAGFWGGNPVLHLSNPVRHVFTSLADWRVPDDGVFQILVLGGSQGAVSLNRAIVARAEQLRELPIRIVHQSGEKSFTETKEGYEKANVDAEIKVFIEEVSREYERAHLIVCRAGAMTVAEVAASGRPAIFVPLPIAGGHQSENCRALVEQGAAMMISQDENTAEKLIACVSDLIESPTRLKAIADRLTAMRGEKSSAERYWECIVSLSEKS